MLVSVDEFTARVNLDLAPGGQDDRLPNIQKALEQAEGIVLDYVDAVDPAWTFETVPANVSSAIMMIAQSILDNSDEPKMLIGMDIDEKHAIRTLLRRYHTPVMA